MKYLLVSLIVLFTNPVFAKSNAKNNAKCEVDASHIGAKYLISEQHSDTENGQQRRFNLWRQGREVAHEYPDANITEIWNLVVDGRLKPVRYFDEHKRGIEYQPSDVNSGKGDRNWSAKYQILPQQMIKSLSLQKVSGQACDETEVYHRKIQNGSNTLEITLEWLPELQLLKSYKEQNANHTLHWTLQKIVPNTEEIDAAFATRKNYYTTDYADIGDNESDPFLLNMINLGFVSHGASGFYNSQGEQLEGQHAHGHAH